MNHFYRLNFSKRQYKRENNVKYVFKDEEIYHLSFIDLKQGNNWLPVVDWSLTNARGFKLPVGMYCLEGRFEKYLDMYRWCKINYISVYLCVSSYTYQGNVDTSVSLDIDKKETKVTGKFSLNVPNIGPILGNDKFRFGWNLDGLFNESTMNAETFEASRHVKTVRINGKRYVKFHFHVPESDRYYVGCDKMKSASAQSNVDAWFAATHGN